MCLRLHASLKWQFPIRCQITLTATILKILKFIISIIFWKSGTHGIQESHISLDDSSGIFIPTNLPAKLVDLVPKWHFVKCGVVQTVGLNFENFTKSTDIGLNRRSFCVISYKHSKTHKISPQELINLDFLF